MDDEKLAENLQQIQQKKKCLIVLDDIWSTDAWDSIKVAFTAEKSISKLMLTSRKVDVAKYVNPKGIIHQPESLSADQSWELLRLKALTPRGDCLDIARDFKRMEDMGREMVKYCVGLPLAIVILGGILVTKPSLIEWEKVYNDSLPSLEKGKGFGQNQQEQLLNILARSYNDLPPQLKPCFLYLGKYREDEWIDAEDLYQLWIAEGIVLSSDKREGETMMQVAESYLGELVHKSMVQVRSGNLESSSTKFGSCSLHDLMRDLSLFKAKEEDFFEAIDLRGGNNFHLSMFAYTRQLVVHCQEEYSSEKARSLNFKKPNHQKYRSMLLMNGDECGSLKPVLGSHFANFKLLRVLALENVYLGRQTVSGNRFGTSIGRVMGSLIYLRYLSVRESNLIIVPWIQKLVLPQTLKLERCNYMSPRSSTVLGKLAHLRHLYLPDLYDDSSRKNFKLRFNGLSKLETLENFDTRWCEVKDLPKLSSLRRLKLKAVGNYDEVKEMFMYLHKLVSSNSCLQYLALVISISDRGLVDNPDMIKELLWNHKFNLHEMELTITGRLPELCELFEQQQQLNHTHFDVSFIRITKLELKWSCLMEDPMPVLEKIPTLRVLVLSIDAYMGKEMVCSAMGFPTLTRLRMRFLPSLEKWRVEEGSMPILQHLDIFKCPKLEELPEGLIFVNSLRILTLCYMPSEFCDRLRSKNGDCLDIARDFKRMEDMGREMVKYCAGLPLAIVILGGILVTKPSLIEWEKVYNDSLPSLEKGKGFGQNQQEQLLNILARSYNDLPPQLKPCFLYLSKYGEDEWIDIETLYQLWIAEGIVLSSDKREGETMMQVAESYMGELVHRSMVQVRSVNLEASSTKFGSCSLHDLMRDLSLFKAKEEDFFEAIDLRERNDFHLNPSGSSLSANTRQLVVYYQNKTNVSYFINKPNHQQYRSILLVNVDGWGSWQRRLGSHLANLKLLRVLDLENLMLSRQSVLGALFGTNIRRVLGSLVYLRYLSVRDSNLGTFPWVQKLVLLQTLKLDRQHFYSMSPGSSTVLGKLVHLRHLYLPDLYLGKSRKNFKLQFNGLSKLETLENFDTRGCEVKDLPKLSSLRRLKLKAVGNYDEVKEMFKYLHKLVSSNSCLQYLALNIIITDGGLVNNPDMIKELLWNHKFNLHELSINGHLPELCKIFEQQQQQLNHTHFDVSFIRITTLELRSSQLEEDPMPVLEKIPTLRDLYLLNKSYMGKEMVCSAMGFPTLTRLEVWYLPNLEKWRVEEGSMPILQHLYIFGCTKLVELPEGLIFLNSLRKLILNYMSSEFYDRLRSKNGEQGPDFYKVAHIPDNYFRISN